MAFGSYAKDEQTKKSDIDFLVEFEKNKGHFDNYLGLYDLFEEIFKQEVDIGKKENIREELRMYINEKNSVRCEL